MNRSIEILYKLHFDNRQFSNTDTTILVDNIIKTQVHIFKIFQYPPRIKYVETVTNE